MATQIVHRILPLEDLGSDQLTASVAIHAILSTVLPILACDTLRASRSCRAGRALWTDISFTGDETQSDQ